jgi:hypothetical protein
MRPAKKSAGWWINLHADLKRRIQKRMCVILYEWFVLHMVLGARTLAALQHENIPGTGSGGWK